MPKANPKPPAIPPAPSNEAEKPVHTIRYGEARGLIWQTGDNGHASFTFTVDRCVTDKAGNNQISQTFLAADVRPLAKVAAEAARWIEWQQKRLAEMAERRS